MFQEGFVGVSFFFILSGFIISYSYKHKIEGHSVSKRTFWVGRIARIYPLHVFTLLVAIFLHREMWQNGVSWLGHFIPNLFLLQAFIPKSGYYYSFNSPSWSLCCEMLFYGLFPFLVKWFRSAWWLVGTIAMFALAIVFGMGFTPDDQTVVNTIWYVNPLVRLVDFFLGMLLYEVYGKWKHVGWGKLKATVCECLAVGLFLLFYLLSDSFSIVYRASVYYWLPVSAVILVFSFQRGYLSGWLSGRVLVYLGEISFGVYLFHYLVLRSFFRIMAKTGWELNAAASFALVLAVTLLLSALSFRYFEKPVNRRLKRLLGA
ncbi:MAG: hypothetical protein BGN96_01605 [Bacteroidales bacterium 45-6]|nr:MAG: hypothetical protein BGN96_01605 [Bacteroidales bacterium 45-6]